MLSKYPSLLSGAIKDDRYARKSEHRKGFEGMFVKEPDGSVDAVAE